MAKEFFRWLRGELNGYYLTNIQGMMNENSKEYKDFLVSFAKAQMNQGEISSDYLYGLGKFAGVYLPRLSTEESISSLRMSESHIENGAECSESGLFETDSETFQFFPDTQGDINNLSTNDLRSSLVGEETVQGYIASSETDVIDGEGKVRSDKILSTPPQDEAYTEFYGNNFLFLSEAEISYQNLSPSLYLDLFKAMQWIRYNGTSLASLCKVIEVICPNGLVKITDIQALHGRYIVSYYDTDIEINLKQQRLSLMEYVLKIKFPQVTMIIVQ